MPLATFFIGPKGTGKTSAVQRGHNPETVHVRQEWTDDPSKIAENARAAQRAFNDALARGVDVAVESVSERLLESRIAAARAAGYDVRIKRHSHDT